MRTRSDWLFRANRELLWATADSRQLTPDPSIEGLIHPREGQLLYALASRAANLGHVVEIGAFKGRSTWYLSRALRDAQSRFRVISIDPQPTVEVRDAFRQMLEREGLTDWVEPRLELSHDAASDFPQGEPVGLVWIDGDHAYEAVRQDFEDWFPRLSTGGWLAVHDTVNNFHGPTRLVRELLAHRSDLTSIGVVYMTLFARKAPAHPLNRLRGLAARVRFEILTLAQTRHAGFGPQWGLPER